MVRSLLDVIITPMINKTSTIPPPTSKIVVKSIENTCPMIRKN